MVKFGVRFEEGSASRHWQSSHVAYGALKKVLKRASQASGRPVGRSNYGPPGRGLLDLEETRRPSDTFLERGLDDDDKRTLETLRGRLLKQNKEDDLSEDDEEAKEYDEEVASLTPTSMNKKLWIRALDRDKSRAFFLHGFDCALAAEVATAERRYAREAASLERRWTAIAPSSRAASEVTQNHLVWWRRRASTARYASRAGARRRRTPSRRRRPRRSL